jgi:hypothetical protein
VLADRALGAIGLALSASFRGAGEISTPSCSHEITTLPKLLASRRAGIR